MKRIGIVILVLMILLSTGCSNSSNHKISISTATLLADYATPVQNPTYTSTVLPTSTPLPTPVGGGLGKLLYRKLYLLSPRYMNVYVYDLLSNTESPITNNRTDPTFFYYLDLNWSPDGSQIIYTGNFHTNNVLDDNTIELIESMKIFTMDRDGENILQISNVPQLSNGYFEADKVIQEWRPSYMDNENIIFISNRADLFRLDNIRFVAYKMNIPTLEISEIFSYPNSIDNLSISPDKTKVVFESKIYSNDENESELYIADLGENGAITRLTQNLFADNRPRWSPDGQWIVYDSNRDGNRELYIIRPDGSEEKRVTNNSAEDENASWSPDGNWLAFNSDLSGVSEAYIQNVNTGDRIQITNSEEPVGYVRWSP